MPRVILLGLAVIPSCDSCYVRPVVCLVSAALTGVFVAAGAEPGDGWPLDKVRLPSLADARAASCAGRAVGEMRAKLVIGLQ